MKDDKKDNVGCGTVLGLMSIYSFAAILAISAVYHLLIQPLINFGE